MKSRAILLLAVTLVLAGCGTATAPPGTLFVAGAGMWRGINLADLSQRALPQLPGTAVQALYDGRAKCALVLVSGGNALLRLDGSGRVRQSVPLLAAPVAMVEGEHGELYVLEQGPRLERVGLTEGRVLARASLPVAATALALSPDGATLVLASGAGHAADLVDTASLLVRASIPLAAAPTAVVTLPFGQNAFLLCGDRLAVVEMKPAGLLTYLVVGPQARSLVAKPDGGEVYVSNASGSVSAIDTNTNEVDGTLPAGVGAGAMLAAPDNTVLYVANTAAGTVSVLSLADRTQIAMVRVGDQPQAMVLSPSGRDLLVADAGSNQVAVVRSNADPQNPNTLLTLTSAPPGLHALLAVP